MAMASKTLKPVTGARPLSDVSYLWDEFINSLNDDVVDALDALGAAIVEDMKIALIAGDHADTGNLVTKLSYDIQHTGSTYTLYIRSGARHDGVSYAEFIDTGTGIYNRNGGGRQTAWRYKDVYGEWHTTHGMRADPFIRPSVEKNLPVLEKLFTSMTAKSANVVYVT